MATFRGPTFRIQSPPTNAAKPSIRMLSVNVNVTSVIVQPKALVSGMRNTLQAYTAPSAICKITPAAAILHRFGKAPFPTSERDEDINNLSSLNAFAVQTMALILRRSTCSLVRELRLRAQFRSRSFFDLQ